MDPLLLISLKDYLIANPQLFIGIILPPLIDIFGKEVNPEAEKQKFLVSLVVCLSVAVLLNVGQIMLNSWDEVFISLGLIFTQSQAVYKLYFKNSYLRSKLLERVYDYEDPKEAIEIEVGKDDKDQFVG